LYILYIQNYIAQPVVFFLNGVELELLGSVVKAKRQRTDSLVRDQRMRLFNSIKIFNINKSRGKNRDKTKLGSGLDFPGLDFLKV
jgi:hypothetical protein